MVLNIILCATLLPTYIIVALVYYHHGKNTDPYTFSVSLTKAEKESEAVDGFLKTFRKEFLILLVVTFWIPLLSFFSKMVSIQLTIWMIWFLGALIIMMIPYARAHRKVISYKKGLGTLNDEDSHWKWGLFYKNPNDSHALVEKRFGIGQTTNFAHPIGKFSCIIAFLALIWIPFFCAYLIVEDYTPMKVTLENDTLICKQLTVEYEIPLSSIKEVALEDHMPEDRHKRTGSGTEYMEKGKYTCSEYGSYRAFIDLTNNNYLRITTDSTIYYINGDSPEETLDIYNQIK